MKVLFLDLDRVCNTDSWCYGVERRHPDVRCWNLDIGREMLDPVRVARVQRVCEATGAVVVIVSGWRRYATFTDIGMLLNEKGLTAPVIGAVSGVKMSGDLRADATRDWLRQHKDVTRYAILDDDQQAWFYYPEFKSYLVQPKDGIEDEHVEEAIHILNEVPRG